MQSYGIFYCRTIVLRNAGKYAIFAQIKLKIQNIILYN